jgi:serine/threonine protein kinase
MGKTFSFPQLSRKLNVYLKRVRREVLVWRQLKHPFILPFMGIHTDESSPLVFIVSPWMRHGTLADYVEASPDYRQEITRLVGIAKAENADLANGSGTTLDIGSH